VFFNRASKEASVQNGLKWPAQKKTSASHPIFPMVVMMEFQ